MNHVDFEGIDASEFAKRIAELVEDNGTDEDQELVSSLRSPHLSLADIALAMLRHNKGVVLLLDRASGDCDGIHVPLHADSSAPVQSKPPSPTPDHIQTVTDSDTKPTNPAPVAEDDLVLFEQELAQLSMGETVKSDSEEAHSAEHID